MARQQYYTDPARKNFEVYDNFSGGLNTTTSNDNLSDKELTSIQNFDLDNRGALVRRHGMIQRMAAPVPGKGQGYFRRYKQDGQFDEILAVDGKLYVNGSEMTITGLPGGFQKERKIEAAQLGDSLFIATGTKLVEFNGSAAVVTPHQPQPLEALYVGLNALSDDPDNYISDGEGTFLQISGLKQSRRYGVINQPVEFEVFIIKPAGAMIEYKASYQHETMTSPQVIRDWGTNRKITFTPPLTGSYYFEFEARVQGGTDDPVKFTHPNYKVREVPEATPPDTSNIHSCNRIMLHWDRLILYGDTKQKDAMYISHLNNGRYFPINHSLMFTNEQKEELTALVRFRDIVIAFTPHSTQILYGTNPGDFRRVMANTKIGCMAPDSAKVMGNYVAFLSYEGVHILKSLGYTENRLNVEKIDVNIDNQIPLHKDACAEVFDNQYHLTLPQLNTRFRFYMQMGVWTKDVSEKLDFCKMYQYDDVLLGQSATTGHVFEFNESVHDDAGYVFKAEAMTKAYNFSQAFNPKKLKELQTLVGNNGETTNASVFVYADHALVLGTDQSHAVVEDGVVKWKTVIEPNIKIRSGTVFGSWILGESPWGSVESVVAKLRITGKCRTAKLRVTHEESKPFMVLGLAFIFKTKKP
jgi:hypothetical protein